MEDRKEEDALDEAYQRLHRTGPEFAGWLSNHGPMVADALVRLGRPDAVAPWLDAYLPRLEPAPVSRWLITDAEWREPLGDASRLGDWLELLARQVGTQPWQAVLGRWWPRLITGALAGAGHGLIRTGHAVRALRERPSELRASELGHALAYWAARWQPAPFLRPCDPGRDPERALLLVSPGPLAGGFRTRVAGIERQLHSAITDPAQKVDTGANSEAVLDGIVDAALANYARVAHSNPVMLVHSVTVPRAIGLVLPTLPRDQWPKNCRTAWQACVAITAAYRPQTLAAAQDRPTGEANGGELVTRAIDSQDAHAIKLAETALDPRRRRTERGLAALSTGLRLLCTDE